MRVEKKAFGYRVPIGDYNYLQCIPTDIELSYRPLLSLHSIIAVSVYPSLINSWLYLY